MSMRISSTNPQHTVNFQRKLKSEEKPVYTGALNDALKFLEVDNLAMIVHGSSFPAVGRDTNIGSPYSKGADKFVDFLKLHGFNGVQLGPGGTIGKKDNSPYLSQVFAKNELFIDLKPLTTNKYANILTDKTLKSVTTPAKSNGENHNETDYNKAFEIYEKALGEAYNGFQTKLNSKDSTAEKLNKEFNNFKENSKTWLEQDGVYKVLAKENEGKEFSKWENPIDKDLMVGVKNNDKASLNRYKELKNKHKDEIEKNSFIQFVADKQMKENNNHRKEIGFSYVGDLLVGFADSDVWANKDAFLPDWKLGCPYGGAENGPQTWGIPVLDPKKLFNQDGSLGVAGKLLKEKVAYSLQNYDNVRVDHALGLVDPYIYKENSIEKTSGGGVRRDRLVGNNVSYLHDVDPNGNFKKVLEKIVLPTFKENGVDKNAAVWEDLCSETDAFKEIYTHQQHLPGITQTEWRRGENSPKENWSLIGSHDSKPVVQMAKNDGTRYSDGWNVDYLSGFLNPDPIKSNEKNEYREKISSSPIELAKAKFTELFRGSKNIQMMFVDMLGIDKVYNYGGQDQPTNWKLRVNNDFEDTYHKSLEKDNSIALNMPEILSKAVRAKADMEVARLGYDQNQANSKREELNQKLNPLLEKLDNFKSILKEKEEIKEAKTLDKTIDTKETTSAVSNPIKETKPNNVVAKKSKKMDTTVAAGIGLAIVVGTVTKIIQKIKNRRKEKAEAKALLVEQQAQALQQTQKTEQTKKPALA